MQSSTQNENSVADSLFAEKEFKYVLIPIASIGCGKTTTFKVIESLYPELVAHIQNDDISRGGSKYKFTNACLNQISQDKNKKIVLCDRNNSSYKERAQLLSAFENSKQRLLSPATGLKYICCNFTSPNRKTLWEATHKRVSARGNNHQSIKADSQPAQVAVIMNGFINRLNKLDMRYEPDNAFSFVINLTVDKETTSLDNAKRILRDINDKIPGLLPNYPPTELQFQDSFDKALSYTPTFSKVNPNNRGAHKVSKSRNSDGK